jgi:uncharacterized protein (UPF0371 family)
MAETNPRHYPYDLLLHIAKTFHFNQFEIIFFSHILNDGEPCYNTEPDLFNDDIEISPVVAKIIERILQHRLYSSQVEQYNIMYQHRHTASARARNCRTSSPSPTASSPRPSCGESIRTCWCWGTL